MPVTPLQIWTEESLAFEDDPDLFVLADRTPIVWTVRGLRHFSPRFAFLGVDIRAVRTPREFQEALSRWNHMEWQLLAAKLQHRPSPLRSDGPTSTDSLAQWSLHAILAGHPSAEALILDLELKARST